MSNKDITISITDLPPAAYDTISDSIQEMMAELMRVMGRYKHLLTEATKITCTYSPSESTKKQ